MVVVYIDGPVDVFVVLVDVVVLALVARVFVDSIND